MVRRGGACPRCGHTTAGTPFCGRCGAHLEAPGTSTAPGAHRTRSVVGALLLGSAAVVALAGGLALDRDRAADDVRLPEDPLASPPSGDADASEPLAEVDGARLRCGPMHGCLRWSVDLGGLGAGGAPPVVHDAGAGMRIVAGPHFVVAIDADGLRRWEADGLAPGEAPGPLPVAVADGLVVVALDDRLEVLDAATGQRLWSAEPTWTPPALLHGAATHDGVLLVALTPADERVDGVPPAAVQAFDVDDGGMRWQRQAARVALAGTTAVLLDAGRLTGLDPVTGEPRWRRRIAAEDLSAVTQQPDRHVRLDVVDDELLAVGVGARAPGGRPRARGEAGSRDGREVVLLDAGSGHELARHDGALSHPGLVGDEEVLLLASEGREAGLLAVGRDGEPVWRRSLGSHDGCCASVVADPERVLLVWPGRSGTVEVLDPAGGRTLRVARPGLRGEALRPLGPHALLVREGEGSVASVSVSDGSRRWEAHGASLAGPDLPSATLLVIGSALFAIEHEVPTGPAGGLP